MGEHIGFTHGRPKTKQIHTGQHHHGPKRICGHVPHGKRRKCEDQKTPVQRLDACVCPFDKHQNDDAHSNKGRHPSWPGTHTRFGLKLGKKDDQRCACPNYPRKNMGPGFATNNRCNIGDIRTDDQRGGAGAEYSLPLHGVARSARP